MKPLTLRLLYPLFVINFNASGQIGIDTVQYQWSGKVNSVGRIYYEIYIYSFYPNGIFSYLSLNSKQNYNSGTWVTNKSIIVLNPEKTGPDYNYQGKFKY